MRERTPEEQETYNRQAQLMFQLNHTMSRTEEYMKVLKELFEDRIGEGSYLASPLNGAASVVTHDVGDYEVAVGSPARVIKKLDPEKFE